MFNPKSKRSTQFPSAPVSSGKISAVLAFEANDSNKSYARCIQYDTAVDWLLRASDVSTLLPAGPHAEHWHLYWTAYLKWDNEENIDLGESTREGLARALQLFLEQTLIGLQEPLWRKNSIDKGLHIMNATAVFETFGQSRALCDPLQRILQDGRWDPVPMLDLLHATEDKQRKSLKLTTDVTNRWTWPSHPYWLLLKQLSVHTALDALPAPAGEHNARMWRVAPVFDFKHPMRAVTTLAQAVPNSFGEALHFYIENNHRMSPKTPDAIFKMCLYDVEPLAAIDSIISLMASHAKHGGCEKGVAWLQKTLPALADGLKASAGLGFLSDDATAQAAYWVPLWDKLMHGKSLESAAPENQFDCPI